MCPVHIFPVVQQQLLQANFKLNIFSLYKYTVVVVDWIVFFCRDTLF